MCLERVDRVYKGTSRKVRKGYKIFRCCNGQLTNLLLSVGDPLPKGLWLDEKYYRVLIDLDEIEATDGTSYPMGWHEYINVDDAIDLAFSIWFGKDWDDNRSLVVSEVYCRGLLAKGVENNRDVEVYRYIKISKEVWHA